jgi:sigma-B regulation protein RsbU (phosphoserine phosphatase)
MESSLMIGAVPDATFGESTARIEPGSRLYLVSDGAVEAENAAGEQFGQTRLTQCISEVQSRAGSRIERIWEELRRWQERDDPADDVVLLEIEFR